MRNTPYMMHFSVTCAHFNPAFYTIQHHIVVALIFLEYLRATMKTQCCIALQSSWRCISIVLEHTTV